MPSKVFVIRDEPTCPYSDGNRRTPRKRQRKEQTSVASDGRVISGVMCKDNLAGVGSIKYPSGDRLKKCIDEFER